MKVLGCQAYADYLQTGASLITFALSTTYAPETPSSFYETNWRAAALYLDGLTYITKNGSEMSGDYILSRIRFTSTRPTTNPVESVAIFDCSKNTNIGYAPFYDKGNGFSLAVMKILKNVAQVNFVVTEYSFNSEYPYFLKMQNALEDGDIDVGFVPVPLNVLKLRSVVGTSATITSAYVLLRQRADRSPDFLLILRPLSMAVWLATLVLGLIFMGLLMFFVHLKPVIGRNLAEGQISTKRDLLEVSILGVVSSFSLTKLQIIPTTLSSRLFALSMWLFSYLLVVLYASAMMTILLRIRKPSNADITVKEVLGASACDKLIVLRNGIAYEAIVASLDDIAQKYTPVESLETAYAEMMKSKKTVLLASSIEASYLTVTNCNLEIIPYALMDATTLTFPYRKSWSLGSQLDFYISVLSKSGMMTCIIVFIRYFETGSCYHPNHNTPEAAPLEPKDTASIYIFLLIGIIMSLLFFGAENISKAYRRRRKRKIFLLKDHKFLTWTPLSSSNYIDQVSKFDYILLAVYNALDLGLAEGDSIEITYFERFKSLYKTGVDISEAKCCDDFTCANISDYANIYGDLGNWLKNIPGNISWSDVSSTQELFFLIRMIKNIYFTTYNLTNGRSQKDLVPRLRSNGNPHTYVLLFKQETSYKNTQELLQLQDGCAPYGQYINSGASLVTFATSKSYAPTIPDPFYNSTWKTSALYLDGLTYITQNGTDMPSEYILSRVDFTETEPTASPVESMVVLDCAEFTDHGVGSYVRGRDPVLVVTTVNSTIDGRTIRVGIAAYPPFFNNGTGFSTSVLSKLTNTAGIHYAITFYNATPDRPYYAAMEEAIIKNEIDAGITPMPLVGVKNENMIASQASLTISYTLLRQHQRRPTDLLLILRPLAMPVWLGSCFLAFIFAGLLMLFGHLKPVIMRNLAEGEMITKTDLFGVSSLGVASSFTLTKLQIIPTTLSSRLFALTMWLFSYLLLVLYASAMMTIMLRVQKPINDDIAVDDVLHPSKCDSIIVLKNGIAYDQIVTSLTNSQRTFLTVDSIQTAYNELMKSKRTVLLATSIEASYISSMDCGLEQIAYTEIYDSLLVFPYNSGWEFGSAFNEYLAIIDGAGAFSKAAAVYFETGPCYHPPYNIPLPVVLELNDAASIYIFLLIGIIVSFIFLGFELLIKRREKAKLSKEQWALVPGMRYPAIIVSMKRNGIYVKVADRPDTVFIPNSQLYSSPLKVYNAIDLGLSEGELIEVQYFGKGADQVSELFCRYYPERNDGDTH
ncbi:unnamed protein product [Rodentolepis nana]|uniref:PBPe domain-containing protein n=1 Tax=Rodentolepis nana TaxID=102285 RepID=A0A0R3T0I6_RODNA|nr:unnamed protein product [Rodentolepis nana]